MFIGHMKAQDYIESSRAYLDYVEEHIENVRKAFDELSRACTNKMAWVADDAFWFTLKSEVERHDLSKLSKEEFCQYRDHFYPTCEKDKENSCFAEAWENHKIENPHHHEAAKSLMDVLHMIIDWMAMSYKFKDDPYDFYLKTKPNMKVPEDWHEFIEEVFQHLSEYRSKGDGKKVIINNHFGLLR